MMNKPFGKPGLPPNWSVAQKQGVGTDAGDVSKVWFTVAKGIVTEVYYPTIDVANIRDIQFLIADGKGFFEEESKDTRSKIEYINQRALAFRVTNLSRSGKYSIIKYPPLPPKIWRWWGWYVNYLFR